MTSYVYFYIDNCISLSNLGGCTAYQSIEIYHTEVLINMLASKMTVTRYTETCIHVRQSLRLKWSLRVLPGER